MTSPIPPRYRRLLATYPRVWRAEHEQVVLGTLLEADDAAGRTRPALRDRVGFLAGGLLVRLPHHVRPARLAARLPIDTAGFHLFDQTNGLTPRREEPEEERHGATLGDSDRGLDRINAVAPAQMHASGSPNTFLG